MQFIEGVRQIAMLCLTAFGCTGNILTLIIVNQHFFRKTTSSILISALSIADCIVLCLQSLQIVTKLRPQVTSYDCFLFFLIDVFRLFSVWIICFINIERCSLIFNPCHMPRLTSRTKSRAFVVILFIISLLIFSHYSFHMHIEYQFDSNRTTPIRSYCAFKSSFHRLTWEFIKSSLTYWFTVPLCVICNVIIIQHLHKALRIERKLHQISAGTNHPAITYKLDLSSKQRQLTAMLVTSSICFVFTATPSTIHTMYLLITRNLNNVQYTVHIFTNILLHFHHASNFLAFMFSCARFRTELIHLFRRCLTCRLLLNRYRRSIPNTEQNLTYSAKQQKRQMKSLTKKIKKQKRDLQPRYQNGIVRLGLSKYKRTHRQSTQPFL